MTQTSALSVCSSHPLKNIWQNYMILKGNAIHYDLFKDNNLTQGTNLTLPEAVNAGKSSLGTLIEWV